jgi:hypothetical protein
VARRRPRATDASRRPSHHRAGSDLTGRARFAARLDRADAGQAQLAVPPVAAGRELEAVAVGLEAKAGEAILAFEAREARLLGPLLHSAEEVLERLVEPLERDLQALRVEREIFRILAPDLGQRLALRRVPDGFARQPVGVDPFLQGGVVQRPVQRAQPLQRRHLGGTGI